MGLLTTLLAMQTKAKSPLTHERDTVTFQEMLLWNNTNVRAMARGISEGCSEGSHVVVDCYLCIINSICVHWPAVGDAPVHLTIKRVQVFEFGTNVLCSSKY